MAATDQSRARQRPLKVYRALRHSVDRSLAEQIGGRGPGASAVVIVAARSRDEARVLFGVTTGDMRRFGSTTSNAIDKETALAEPGQVFASTGHERQYVRARADGHRLIAGTSDLALAEELLATEKAEKAAAVLAEEARVTARAERLARNQHARRRAGEAVDRLRPVLAEAGIHPDTVVVDARGVWLPPEVAETVAGLLEELAELRSL